MKAKIALSTFVFPNSNFCRSFCLKIKNRGGQTAILHLKSLKIRSFFRF